MKYKNLFSITNRNGWKLLLGSLLFVFLVAAPAKGQGWIRYTDKFPCYNAVKATPDGGVLGAAVLFDSMRLTKYDAQGNKQFQKTILPQQGFGNGSIYRNVKIINAQQGKFGILVSNADVNASGIIAPSVWFLFDSKCNLLLEKVLDNPIFSCGTSAVETPDGNFIFFGKTLIKVDTAGNQLWSKPNLDSFMGRSLASNSSGALLGISRPQTVFGATYESYLTRFSADTGDSIWTRYSNCEQIVSNIIATDDNNFIYAYIKCTGTSSSISRFKKIDADGNTIWDKASNYVTNNSIHIYDNNGLVAEENGGAAFFTYNEIDYKTYITKINGDGSLIFNSLLSNSSSFVTLIYAADSAPNGGYYIGGEGNTSFVAKTDSYSNIYNSVLYGKVFKDENFDCALQAGEKGLENRIFRIDKPADGTYYFFNGDKDGNYKVNLDTGSYVMKKVNSQNMPLWTSCQPAYVFQLSNNGDSIKLDLPQKTTANCPLLSVDISTSVLRRCFSNNYYNILYCNYGTATAENAYIDIKLDTFLIFESASIPLASQTGNTLRFQLGNISADTCGSFYVQAKVSCDAVLGQTHCTEARIYPDTNCVVVPNWSGANIVITGVCVGDSVRFKIQNTGTGNMPNSQPYYVIEDDVIFMTQNFQLNAGQSTTVSFPANGKMRRVQTAAIPNHPYQTAPAAWVEACGNAAASFGFVTQYPTNSNPPSKSVSCIQNGGSFDPNDKQGFPTGYGSNKYIGLGQDLEYMIRFQNTGTDTAFTVVIRDTLPAFLTPATLQAGASSHSYELEVYDKNIVKFTFSNILLVDSTRNEPASHGFVKFKVQQSAAAALGSVIQNKAAIYFDYNAPVITNLTTHKIGKDYVIVKNIELASPNMQLKAYPNPFSEKTTLELTGVSAGQKLIFSLYDVTGKILKKLNFVGNNLEINASDLPQGNYYFQIHTDDAPSRWIGSGKLTK